MTGSIIFAAVLFVTSIIGAIALYIKGTKTKEKWVTQKFTYIEQFTYLRKQGTRKVRVDNRELFFGLAIACGFVAICSLGYICSTF